MNPASQIGEVVLIRDGSDDDGRAADIIDYEDDWVYVLFHDWPEQGRYRVDDLEPA